MAMGTGSWGGRPFDMFLSGSGSMIHLVTNGALKDNPLGMGVPGPGLRARKPSLTSGAAQYLVLKLMSRVSLDLDI